MVTGCDGYESKFSCIDEFKPPVHEWSFESEIMMSCDETIFNELMKIVYCYRHSSPLPLIPLELLDAFNDPRPFAWYNIDYQRQISYDVLLLCEPRKEPEHNYYQEYVDHLPLLKPDDPRDSLEPTRLLNNFYKALTSQIPDTIEKYRKELDDACRKEQIRREQSIQHNRGF